MWFHCCTNLVCVCVLSDCFCVISYVGCYFVHVAVVDLKQLARITLSHNKIVGECFFI